MGLGIFLAAVLWAFVRSPLRTLAALGLCVALGFGIALPYAEGVVWGILLAYLLVTVGLVGGLLYWSARSTGRKGDLWP